MIELIFFRVREAGLHELPPASVPKDKDSAIIYLGRRVEIKPDDNKLARIFSVQR